MTRFSLSKNTPDNYAADKAIRLYEQVALDNTEQFGVFLSGDVSSTNETNTPNDGSSVAERVAVYSKIVEDEVSLVAERNDFITGNVYNHWTSVAGNRTHYALNTINNTVYLCIRGAANPFWRLDLESKSSFQSVPSNLCETEYSDGSVWRGLYKLDSAKELRHLGRGLPFTTLTDEERKSRFFASIGEDGEASIICGANGRQSTGTCCLYHKNGWVDPITGVTFAAGDFYKCDCTKCYRCIDMAKRMKMDYVFTPAESAGSTADSCLGCDTESFPTNCGACECSIEQKTVRERVTEITRANPVSSLATSQAIINSCDDNGGQIVSMFIDFSGLNKEDLRLVGNGYNLSWPLTIQSDSGQGAEWEVVGYTEDKGQTWYASGLKKVSEGSNYLNATVTNLDSIFANGFSVSRLQINISPIGGFIENIESILSNVRTQVSKSFRTSELRNDYGTTLSEFTRVGIVKNMTVADGSRVLGYGTNTNQPLNKRLTTKFTATPSTSKPSAGQGTGITPPPETPKSSTTSPLSISFTNVLTNAADDTKSDVELYVTNPDVVKSFTDVTDPVTEVVYTIDQSTVDLPSDQKGDTIDVGSGTYLSTKKINWTVPTNLGTGQQAERSYRVIITL